MDDHLVEEIEEIEKIKARWIWLLKRQQQLLDLIYVHEYTIRKLMQVTPQEPCVAQQIQQRNLTVKGHKEELAVVNKEIRRFNEAVDEIRR